MKKSILIRAAAVAVTLAVVLIAATVAVTLAIVLSVGCVWDNGQQLTAENGIVWKYTDDAGTIVRYISLSDDGTGTCTEYKKVTAESGGAKYKVSVDSTISWTKEADETVKILNAYGINRVFTKDKKRVLLTSSSGKVYQQVWNAASGLADFTSMFENAQKENTPASGTSETGVK